MLKREEIRIRDPFIYTDVENKCYYMYGTTSLVEDKIVAKNTFSVYRTLDLENFEEPKVIFDGNKHDFWADRDFWAAELHKYNGKYYLFGSCKAENKRRATHIFVCDTPDGEFVPLTKDPATPLDWECLDGTFWVEDGKPYIVFCHEWKQIDDGEICALQLSEDLKEAVGEPVTLFSATDNPNVSPLNGYTNAYVTDGPFLYREDGKVKMMWSSFYQGRYLVLDAWSDSLLGKWNHGGSRFDFDGGHAMRFQKLDGTKMISLHVPNKKNMERATFYEW